MKEYVKKHKTKLTLTFIILIIATCFVIFFSKNIQNIKQQRYTIKKLTPEIKRIKEKIKQEMPLNKSDYGTYITYLVMNKKYDKAIEVAEKYRNFYSEDPDAYYQLALLYLVKASLKISPSMKELYKERAKIELMQGEKFSDKSDYLTMMLYGQMFEQLGLFVNALGCYKKALDKWEEFNINEFLEYSSDTKTKERIISEHNECKKLLEQFIKKLEDKLDKNSSKIINK